MKRQTDRNPYRGRDPRTLPAYTVFDASRYLRIPENTIRNWAYGYQYPTRAGKRKTTPALLEVEAGAQHDFSFFNLVELHVLNALRRVHNVQMPKIRNAVEYLKQKLDMPRPLIEELETDGLNVFVTKYGSLINASAHGQLAMKQVLEAHLKRIDRDPRGLALRLFPFTWRADNQGADAVSAQPRLVAIDARVAFGRPVIVGSRVPTIEVFDRFNAGESPDDLAEDFGRQPAEIYEAIRCETAATP